MRFEITFAAIEEIFHVKEFETFDLEGQKWCKFEQSKIPANYQRSSQRDVRKIWVVRVPELHKIHRSSAVHKHQ